jgi:hypothetical protein
VGSILINTLSTDLSEEANSTFGIWLGTPLATNLTSNSEFDGYVVKGVSTPLTVTSIFSWTINSTRALVTTLDSENTFTGSKINLSFQNTVIPDLAAIAEPVPAAQLPHLFSDAGNRPPITFTFTYADVNILILNAPDFGDSENLRMIRDKKYSRGNTLIITQIPAWGNEKIYEYAFSYLTAVQKEQLLLILRNLLGIKIGITDHLGIFRLGYILTPETDAFEPVPNGYSATIRFQEVDS